VSTFIGVPEKGRNAGIALREELPERYDTEYILDVLNGAGKKYAKNGLNRLWIERAVDKLDSVEFRDTGRNFRRPVFTKVQLEDARVESYQQDPLELEADRFYQGFDELIEQNYSAGEISTDFEDLVEEVAEEEGYELDQVYGDEVKWGVMNTDLDVDPETVLVPEEFQEIGQAAAESYWGAETECLSFNDYLEGSKLEEEELLAETPEEVAGAYMFVSGDTAEEAGLEYEAVNGMVSRLGRFEKAQNQYKNSDESNY